MPFNLGFTEVLLLLVVSVIVFGGNLPEVARKVAAAVSDFKRGMREEFRKIDEAADTSETIDPEPPAEWERPPDGEDCQGLEGP